VGWWVKTAFLLASLLAVWGKPTVPRKEAQTSIFHLIPSPDLYRCSCGVLRSHPCPSGSTGSPCFGIRLSEEHVGLPPFCFTSSCLHSWVLGLCLQLSGTVARKENPDNGGEVSCSVQMHSVGFWPEQAEH
jgi:hypothetical protein